MKKFKFSLEAVLKLRSLEEAQAQKELQEIRAKVRSQELVLHQMYESVEKSYQLGLEYKVEGEQVSPKLEVVDVFIHGQNKRIELKREEIRRLKQQEEEKQEAWLQKRKEKKALEVLREKKYEEFKKEVSRKETIKIDDMISARYVGSGNE